MTTTETRLPEHVDTAPTETAISVELAASNQQLQLDEAGRRLLGEVAAVGNITFAAHARSMTRDPLLADDLVCGALERVGRAIANGRYASQGPDTLVRITHRAITNGFIDHWRKEKRLSQKPCDPQDTSNELHLASNPVYDTYDISPVTIVVRRVLKTATKEQQEIYQLRFVEELSQPEIAEKLGLPLGTIKSRIGRLNKLFADPEIRQAAHEAFINESY